MKSRRAFTLIELILVIAIIAILSAILYGVIVGQIRKGRAAASMNNLKQWGTAFTASLADNDGRMPYDGENGNIQDSDAWFNRLPQYLQEKSLSDPLVAQNAPRAGQKNVWINPAVPSKDAEKYTNPPQQFLFCYGMNQYLATDSDKTQKFNRVEQPVGTVLMAEKCDSTGSLAIQDVRAYFGDSDPLTGKDNGAHFLFCDGHVELRKRSDFDPSMMSLDSDSNPSPVDNVKVNSHFTLIPYPGAVANP